MNEGALFVDVSIEESENVDATIQDVMEVPGSGGGTGTNDYRQLSNLPSLNGRKIIGDISETDPTVPEWAKEPFPPVSTERFVELSAKVGEMLPADASIPVSEIDKLFSGVAEARQRVANSVSFVSMEGITAVITNTLTAVDKRVEKIPGKGLSTNDFDNAAKEKLAGIEAGANKTVTDSVLNADSTNPIQNKVVYGVLAGLDKGMGDLNGKIDTKSPINSPVFTGAPAGPTATQGTNTTQLATTEFVQNAIAGITAEEFELIKVVTVLPETGVANKIYLVPIDVKSGDNQFNEFLWVNNAWEYVGTQALNLDGYVKADDMVEITFAEIEQMFTESGGSDAEI